jgi:hypothetical protein
LLDLHTVGTDFDSVRHEGAELVDPVHVDTACADASP